MKDYETFPLDKLQDELATIYRETAKAPLDDDLPKYLVDTINELEAEIKRRTSEQEHDDAQEGGES